MAALAALALALALLALKPQALTLALAALALTHEETVQHARRTDESESMLALETSWAPRWVTLVRVPGIPLDLVALVSAHTAFRLGNIPAVAVPVAMAVTVALTLVPACWVPEETVQHARWGQILLLLLLLILILIPHTVGTRPWVLVSGRSRRHCSSHRTRPKPCCPQHRDSNQWAQEAGEPAPIHPGAGATASAPTRTRCNNPLASRSRSHRTHTCWHNTLTR
jgi:hypothetical protein